MAKQLVDQLAEDAVLKSYKDKKNDLEVNLNYLNVQLTNKTKLYEELTEKLKAREAEFKNIEDNLISEKKSLLAQIDERNLKSKERELKASEIFESATRLKSELEQEKTLVIHTREELMKRKTEYEQKLAKIQRFAEEIKAA